MGAAAKKVVATKKDCDGTVCPGGCCPEQNWYCCPDGMYCAADASNCPFVAAKEKLIKFAAAKKVVATKKDCDGTVCPGGCCPEQNWYCCPDGMYCAANAGNCPQTHRQTDRQTDTPTDRQTETDRQTYRQTERQTD